MTEPCPNDSLSGGGGGGGGNGGGASDSPGLCVSQKIHWPHNVTCYLVKFYRMTPCLWDHSHRDYSDKAAKERALQQFSVETGYPVEAVRKKLINLRNQFTNEWQKMDRSSNSAKPYRTKWAFYRPLSFLKDVVLPRKPRNAAAAMHHDGISMRMAGGPFCASGGLQGGLDPRSLDMNAAFSFARERRHHHDTSSHFHNDGMNSSSSSSSHNHNRASSAHHNNINNEDGSHHNHHQHDGANATVHLDGAHHQENSHHEQPQDQDVSVLGAGADVEDLELSQSSNSLVLSPEVTLEEPSSSERRILPAEDDSFHQEIRPTYTFPGERYGDLQRGDHVDSFTCYIGTELRRIPDEETVGALKLQILKLIFDAQATTTNYNTHPPQ